MPSNTRNVWIDARIDGRASTLSGGPTAKDGGMSATIHQRSNSRIGDAHFHVSTFANGAGRIVTDARVASNGNSYGRPSLSLETHRDKAGETFTLDLPGLTGAFDAGAWCSPETSGDYSATLKFRTESERDAFLSTLAVWRDAQAEVSA